MIIDEMISLAKDIGLNLYAIAVDEGDGVRCEKLARVNNSQPIYSVSKNFTTVGVLMCVERGFLSLDDNVYDMFRKKYPRACREDWKKVTLRNCLTQTSGIGRMMIDVDCDNCAAYPTRDYLEYQLNEPFVTEPGTEFCYSDSHFYLAGRMASEAMGGNLGDFLQKELFAPMNFQSHAFSRCPDNHIIGGSGLFLRVEDLHKFARMLTDRGVYEGRRYLSEATIADASKKHVVFDNGDGYGYSFWHPGNSNAYHGSGMLGQFIYMSPDRGLSAAWLCYDEEGKSGQLCRFLLRGEKQ